VVDDRGKGAGKQKDGSGDNTGLEAGGRSMPRRVHGSSTNRNGSVSSPFLLRTCSGWDDNYSCPDREPKAVAPMAN
jgi:hypothetical protein